jgi:hypothetical protein
MGFRVPDDALFAAIQAVFVPFSGSAYVFSGFAY